ncbi:MAG: TonB-dependent receptor domain-containing protein, partial [Candidatus Binatia bacterium]
HRLGVDGLAALYGYGFPNNVFTVTTRFTGERFSPLDEVALEEARDADRGAVEAAAEEEYQLPSRGVTLLASVSVEHAETKLRRGASRDRSDTLTSPRAGLRWDALPGFSLRANAGRFYRIPTFLELFGNTGTILGNPDLDPESGWSADLGARYQLIPLWLFEVTGFFRDTNDLIVFEQNSQRTSIAMNVSRARALGVELSASGRVRWLDLQGNFTFQDLEDRSRVPFLRGNDLPGRPRRQGFGRASLASLPVEPFFEVDLTGANFLDRANLVKAPARTILNAGAGFDAGSLAVWLAGLRALLELKNLTDNRILDVAGFPLPGRSYFGSLTYEF